ncbi:MAG: inosine/xanthosine triphosphatase [Thermoplasmatota archaeon]
MASGSLHVCMGGTFDVFHRGHEALLAHAFGGGEAATGAPATRRVFVGITSDAFANARRARAVSPYEERAAAVRGFLAQNGWSSLADVGPIEDTVGRALEPAFQAIAVTPDTVPGAIEINRQRLIAGLPPLQVLVAPLILAEDGLPVSATRIRGHEVDREGRILGTVRVAVGSENPSKVDPVRAFLSEIYKVVDVRGFGVHAGVADQPFGESTWDGAMARAASAHAEWPEAHFAIGIEAGILESAVGPFDIQACVALDRGGRMTVGQGPGFAHPPEVWRALDRGETVGDAIVRLSGDARTPRSEGAVGFLSGGLVTRSDLTRAAVAAAWVPRIRPGLYGIDRTTTPTRHDAQTR